MSPIAHAQVVTSRLVSADTLDNPAAATFRKHEGIFLRADRNDEKLTALELSNSSFGIATTTNVLQTSLLFQSSTLFAEANVALQSGRQTISSSVTGAEFENTVSVNSNSITLIPVQAILGFRSKSWGRFGVKVNSSSASNDLDNNFRFVKTDFTSMGQPIESLTSVVETNSQKNHYLVVGLGAVFNLFGSGLHLGVGADSIELAIHQRINGVSSRRVENSTTENATNTENRTQINVIKQLYGLSYLHQKSKFSLRTELNHQRMPPLDSNAARYETGELSRGTLEMIYDQLYGGVEVASQRGYFVDPNNLVPIYFNFAHLTKQSTVSFGFFGGFRLSAGSSFGITYFQSQAKTRERLSASDLNEYLVERQTRSFGASYSYVF